MQDSEIPAVMDSCMADRQLDDGKQQGCGRYL
jgi:hypothetical protein